MTASRILDLIDQAECDHDGATDYGDFQLAAAIDRHIDMLTIELEFFFN